MTSSLRPRGRSAARRHSSDPEQRFQTWVTIGFIALIVAVIAIIVVGLAYDYWKQHYQAVATVNGASITRDQWVDRARLDLFRLDQREQDIREAVAAGSMTQDEADLRLQSLTTAKNNAASTAIEELIGLTLEGQLAAGEGVTVTDADVELAITRDATSAEGRKLQLIVVDPTANADGTGPASESAQAAYAAAHQAAADLAAGKAFADVAKEYSTDASADSGGDVGVVTRDSTLDPAFLEAVFSTPEGGLTPLIAGADGSYRIGKVNQVLVGTVDPGFEKAVRAEVSWDAYRANARAEALARALQDKIVGDASGGEVEQRHLAQVFLAGDPTADAKTDTGTIHASHILFSPQDDVNGASSLAPDDPAWALARADAEQAARSLRAITDPDARALAFADRARTDSDDTGSGANGGDLGFFNQGGMVKEFADALFGDETLKPGDIVGPVKTDYGWHVIEFQERTPSLRTRLDDVKARLAATGADFAAIAAAVSEAPEAGAGGDLGWKTRDQLSEAAAKVAFGLEAGAVSDPVAEDDGYHVYKLLEKATRALDAEQKAGVAATAFSDWYDPRKAEAEKNKAITRDPAVFASSGAQ